MDSRSTKQKILDAALDLFSTQGFEATSVSQIADEVGIRKASLYSHFASKKEILESLMQEIMEQYEWHSIFSENNSDMSSSLNDGKDLNIDSVTQMIVGQIRYIIHEPQIVKARKMLTIEQFRNPILAKAQTKQNYTNVMNFFIGIIEFLIQQQKLSDNDAEIMAAQLCLPISVWLNLCDREPEREDEVTDLIERHVRQFFRMYGKPAYADKTEDICQLNKEEN